MKAPRPIIAITFALPDESRDLIPVLRHPGSVGSQVISAILGNLGPHEVIVLHTGMGAARTRERLCRWWDEEPSRQIQCVISAGYAGGLDPKLPAESLVLAENYSSPDLLAAANGILRDRCHTGLLTTVDTVMETPEAKAKLAKSTGAIAVDMETATIAAVCRERGVPLLSLRVISDTAQQTLAVPFSVCFDAKTERPRIAALLWFLFRHPSRLPGFIQFVMTVNRARQALTGALIDLVENGFPPESQV